MPDIPSLIMGLILVAYWGRVMRLVYKIRKTTGRDANLRPKEPLGMALRVAWYPAVVIWIVHPLVNAFHPRHLPRWMMPLFSSAPAAWAATLIAILAFIGTLICWKKMGKSWRMGINPGEKTQLIVSGPYAYVRHPIYALSSVLMICSVVILSSPLMLVVALIHLWLLQWEARREEKYLIANHGAVYQGYMSRTGRFVPKSTRPYKPSLVSVTTGPREQDVFCNILLFFSTQTEKEQLERAAMDLKLEFRECQSQRIGGIFYSMGMIGGNRVNAVRTKMGPFFHQGSASQAVLCRTATTATSIIQLGMGFGIDRKLQRHGDVLVSEWIFPYDYRIVRHAAPRYAVDYSQTKRHPAHPGLLRWLAREQSEGRHAFRVHVGGLLSGGARIFSQPFLRELLADIAGSGTTGGYVGGEMEGAGLLSVCERTKPIWIVVKGISDFADDERDTEIQATRPQACYNAAYFVLCALRRMGSGAVPE